MPFVVTFQSRTPIPIPGSGLAHNIWSYKVEASGSDNLQNGTRIALGLPSDVEVQNPAAYPNVEQLVGTFVDRDAWSSRQFVGRTVSATGPQTISFVAPAAETTSEVVLFKAPSAQAWAPQPFSTGPNVPPRHVQVLRAPVPGPAVSKGRPLVDFKGSLPYASELFGIYQPLLGWLGAQNTLWAMQGAYGPEFEGLSPETFFDAAARTLDDTALAALAERYRAAAAQAALSPVGLVNLFRQYFFEFDSFLGTPAGHLWLSPGGTVEVVEVTTRRTLVEKAAEQAEEVSRKVEESLTDQDDIADAVKEDNANDTKLGVSATGGVQAGIYHGDASASFSTQSTVKRSSEETHKHSRTQSAKVSSEIKRNFKTTFKTVTEATDSTSRRYVVQNTTGQLANYELRRKMRKVGVQLQHIGSRLCWQVYLDDPGRGLGMGDLVHLVPGPDLTSIKKPEPPPPLEPKTVEFTGPFPIRKYPGTSEDIPKDHDFWERGQGTGENPGSDDILCYEREHHLVAKASFTAAPPEPGYVLKRVAVKSAQSGGKDCKFVASPRDTKVSDEKSGNFTVFTDFINTGDANTVNVTFLLTWDPPSTNPAHDQYQKDLDAYNARIGQAQREAYANAVRERLQLVSAMRPRPSEDLRSEERQTVYGELIHRLKLFEQPHLNSEAIRQIFDVDEMLYFVAPDFWRPKQSMPPPSAPPPSTPDRCSVGRYPVQADLDGATVASWYSYTDKNNPDRPNPAPAPAPPAPCPPPPAPEWRVDYLITEKTQPAPLGSSLGWLIQIDGDQRRNEFLNAAWAKAVLPIRPGHELDALQWLKNTVEGQAAFGLDYPYKEGVDPVEYKDKKVGAVLELVAAELQKSNTLNANTLQTEEVYEHGFDPLVGGFRPAEPYQVFDQWIEVLPTDQVVAVQVSYDPKTGAQELQAPVAEGVAASDGHRLERVGAMGDNPLAVQAGNEPNPGRPE